MSNIKIQWPELDQAYEEILVYRATEAFTRDNLPAEPYARLTPDAREFVDEDVPTDTMFYYMTLGRSGDFIGDGRCVGMMCPTKVGPGPQTIVRGDWDLGYFGTCKLSDLTAIYDIRQITGLTGIQDTSLCKVARRGRVYYIPFGHIGYNRLATAYVNGAAYPFNDPDRFNTYLVNKYGVVNQQRRFTFGDNEYRISVVHAHPEPGSAYASTPDLRQGTLRDIVMPFFDHSADDGLGRLAGHRNVSGITPMLLDAGGVGSDKSARVDLSTMEVQTPNASMDSAQALLFLFELLP